MVLPLAIAEIRNKSLAAIQALAGRFLFYRQTQNEPPNLRKLPASKKKILALHTSEQDEQQNEGTRALWEAFEENARAEESAFQTGQRPGGPKAIFYQIFWTPMVKVTVLWQVSALGQGEAPEWVRVEG